MKLLHLKGTNYRSFAEFELDLNASGLFSVTGRNGAGKSSIFSAVEWALFGGKRGSGSERVRRQGAEGNCRVELEFEIGGRALRVVRIEGKDAWLTDVATGDKLATGLPAHQRGGRGAAGPDPDDVPRHLLRAPEGSAGVVVEQEPVRSA